MSKKIAMPVVASIIMSAPAAVFAHDGGHTVASLASGLMHPVSGMDHVLAMVAAGMLAEQLGAGSRWRLPGCFVALMLGGAAVGMSGMAISVLEFGIAASIIFFGLVVALPMNLHRSAIATGAGIFAALHGYAHGVEIPIGISGAGYSAGFVAATTLLIVLGMFTTRLTRYLAGSAGSGVLRLGGFTIACSGLYLMWV
jgi:urease accessory protein